MNKKTLSLLCGAVLTAAFAPSSMAAPLPAGTKLLLDQGVGSAPNLQCATGSCFSMEVAPGFKVWTDFGAGTDGGFVVGKDQISGGQELAPSSVNTTPGQITNAWLFFSNYGTFYTSPEGGSNIFDDTSCAGAACTGKTVLNAFNVAWNGGSIPMGSAAGCTLQSCTADQTAGIFISNYQIDMTTKKWSLDYSQVVPTGSYMGVKFGAHMSGTVQAVPLPAAVWLFGSGLVGLAAVARRKKGKA
jgi:hypothetical protein